MDDGYMRLCAWCKNHMGGPKFAPLHKVTHGICPECIRREVPDQAEAIIAEVEKGVCSESRE